MPQTPIDVYLNDLAPEVKTALQNLRQTIRTAIPAAEELITYQIPTFKVDGKAVAGFEAYKDHLSFFPFSGSLLKLFKDETKDFKQTKGSLHFTLDKPIPNALIIQMVKAKLEMNSKNKTR